jgi:hypothetical protein
MIHKGGGPAGDRERASAAGVRSPVSGDFRAALAALRIKARNTPGIQPTGEYTQEVERTGYISVRVHTLFGDNFSTCRATPGPDGYCDRVCERDTPHEQSVMRQALVRIH